MGPAGRFSRTNGSFVWTAAARVAAEGPRLEKEGARVEWRGCAEQMLQVEENFPPFGFDQLVLEYGLEINRFSS